MQGELNRSNQNAAPAAAAPVPEAPERKSNAGNPAAAEQSTGGRIPKKPRLPLWTALTSYGIGYLYVVSFVFGFVLDVNHRNFPRDWAVLLFAAVFFVWSEVVLRAGRSQQTVLCSITQKDEVCKSGLSAKGKGEDAPRENWFWMICTLVMAIASVAGRCRATGTLVFWALHGTAAYWVLCRSGMLTENCTGPFFAWDVFDALVIAPFGGFFARIQTVAGSLENAIRSIGQQRRDRKTDYRALAISAVLVLLALPVLLTAGRLLGQVDAAFAGFWEQLEQFLCFRWPQLPDWLAEAAGEFGGRLLVSLPVGAYLYGLVSARNRRQKTTVNARTARAEAEKARIAPAAGMNVIFALFCALYAIFFLFQAGHLFSAFVGVVPGASTASEYAREGFFQLCQVMAINFGLLLAAAKLSRIPLRQNRQLKAFSVLLMAESLLLAVTAASRLWLYIDRFGFTPRRLLSSWAVLVLAAGCVLAIASLHKPCRAVQKWIWFAAGSFALLCLY